MFFERQIPFLIFFGHDLISKTREFGKKWNVVYLIDILTNAARPQPLNVRRRVAIGIPLNQELYFD